MSALAESDEELERMVLAHVARLERLASASGPLSRSVPRTADARFYELARELVPAMCHILRRRLRPEDSPTTPD